MGVVHMLKQMRLRRGVTQSELSDLSGVNLRTIQGYESGNKNISTASCITVLALSDALECSVRDIIYNETTQMTLQQMRLKRGLSQSQLAKKADISVVAIQNFEQGRRSLDTAQTRTVLKLAQALGCDVRDILG